MKNLMKLRRLLSVLIVPAMVLCAGCSDPVDDLDNNDDNNTGELTGDEADRISDAFDFGNSVKVTGKVPTVANTSLVKTDSKDTIYSIRGLKIPLRISHPEAVVINGWFIAVKNSTFYYDVPIHDEEDSDTVSVIFFEVDPDDGELPYDIPIEITPYDQNKTPIDIIERILTIEDPDSGGCDLLVDGDTTGIGPPEWVWHATILFDSHGEPTFVNAPGRIFGAKQTIGGCCDENPAVCPQAVYNPVFNATELIYDSEVDAQTSYSIELEFFDFYKNGTFKRVTLEKIRNFSEEKTDWCNEVPGYNDRDSYVEYYGTHNYSSGNSSISYATLSASCQGICGYGSRGGALTVSCHMMVITAGGEGSREVRMYTRHSASMVWYD